jgi:hypothetical protein
MSAVAIHRETKDAAPSSFLRNLGYNHKIESGRPVRDREVDDQGLFEWRWKGGIESHRRRELVEFVRRIAQTALENRFAQAALENRFAQAALEDRFA